MDRTTAANYTTDGAGHRVFQDRNLSTGTPGTTQSAADHTAYQEEILGPIEAAGITPDAGNNKQLLAALQALFGGYAVDTSAAANALVVTLSPAPAALKDGMVLRVKPAFTNTGPATLNVNGLGAWPITSATGAPLAGGELFNGNAATLICSFYTTSFVLVAPAWATSNAWRNMVVLTSSTVWTVPVGVTRIKIRGVGGGGGSAAFIGGNADMPGCGGGAGYFEGIYTVIPGTAYTVTIGAGGLGGTSSSSNGVAGGTTAFGSLASAGGGFGGVNGANPAGGAGGTAAGGQINVQGGDGTDGLFVNGYTSATNIQGGPGLGGSTPLGHGARSGMSNALPGRGYGGGAGAPYAAGGTTVGGATGAPGVVIVEW